MGEAAVERANLRAHKCSFCGAGFLTQTGAEHHEAVVHHGFVIGMFAKPGARARIVRPEPPRLPIANPAKGTCVDCGYKAIHTADLAAHYREAHCVETKLSRLVALYGGLCFWCGLAVVVGGPIMHELRATKEHLIPRSKGGRNTADNLRLAHRGCNFRRGTMPENEYRAILAEALEARRA